MDKKYKSDVGQAKTFLKALASGGDVTFQTFDDSEAGNTVPQIFHGKLKEHYLELIKLNKDGAGIYVMVNEGDGKGRKKENVKKVRAVFVDLDGAPLEPVRNARLKPHIIVESSPGKYHAYWFVREIKLSEFKEIQKSLAEKFGGDTKVNDLCRVMRVPGFYHRKGKPVISKIIMTASHQPYDRDQFVSELTLKIDEKKGGTNNDKLKAKYTESKRPLIRSNPFKANSGLYDPEGYYCKQFGQLPPPNSEGWVLVNCPFHDDSNPSMSINLEHGGFNCFACRAKGSSTIAFDNKLNIWRY